MQIISSYFQSQDQRGEIFGVGRFPWMQEINYIESLQGSVRGGHYHKETQELFFILAGEIKVEIEQLKTKERKTFIFKKKDIFLIEPYEVHTFFILEDAKWINILSRPMDPQKPDFHKPPG